MGANPAGFVSIHGKRLGLTPNGLVADGQLVTNPFIGRNKFIYLDSAIGGSSGGSPFDAVATLAAALALAVSGDIIVALPGHAENIANSTAVTLSVAGVSVVGVGNGRLRPTFTFTAANTATVNVAADKCGFYNCRFAANFLSIAAPFTLAAAKSFRLDTCSFMDTSSVLDFLNIVKSTGIANTVDGLAAEDCSWNGLGTTSVNSFILSANDIDGVSWLRNKIKLARTADASILATITAGVITNADVGDNRCYSAQTATTAGSLINVGGTTSTGFVYRNYVQTLTTSSDKLFTTSVGLAAFENRVSGAVGATGFVIPAVDS